MLIVILLACVGGHHPPTPPAPPLPVPQFALAKMHPGLPEGLSRAETAAVFEGVEASLRGCLRHRPTDPRAAKVGTPMRYPSLSELVDPENSDVGRYQVPPGRILLTLQIAGDGTVSSAVSVRSTLLEPQQDCVVAEVSELRFPNATAQTQTIHWPLDLLGSPNPSLVVPEPITTPDWSQYPNMTRLIDAPPEHAELLDRSLVQWAQQFKYCYTRDGRGEPASVTLAATVKEGVFSDVQTGQTPLEQCLQGRLMRALVDRTISTEFELTLTFAPQ